MISTYRAFDQLLNKSVKTPNTKLDFEGLDSYRKRVSSNESNQSKNSEQNIEIKASQSFSEKSVKYVNSKMLDSNFQKIAHRICQFKEGKNMYKTLKKAQLVKKFQDNLFQTSHVLKSDQKKFQSQYQQDLEEKTGINLSVKTSNKSQNFQNIISLLSWIQRLFKISIQKQNIELRLINLIINQSSYFHKWEIFSLCMQIFKLQYCPFIISFGQHDEIFKGIDIFIIVFSFCEFLLTKIFNSLTNECNLDKVAEKVEEKYQNIKMIMSILFWTIIYLGYSNIVIIREIVAIGIMVLILQKISKKYEKIVERLFLKGVNVNLLDLFTLFLQIIGFTHFVGCLWHYIGDITSYNQNSWLNHYDLINENAFIKYNYSIYWATTTIATVGYGDVTPQNQFEILFATIVMLISSCMFAYSINSIGLIVNGMYLSNQKQKRSLALVNSYMKAREINYELQSRVRNFLKFNVDKEIIENYESTQKLIESFPIELQEQLEQEARNIVVGKMNLLQNKFSKSTINKLSQLLQRTAFKPLEVLYHSNNQYDKFLYFVSVGEIELLDEQSKRVLKTCKAGDVFGEYQFFTNQNTREAVICTQFTELYKIDRESFIKLISQNTKDFQRFHKIKDQLLYKQDYSQLENQCSCCLDVSHSSLDCPITRHIPNRYITILKNNYSENNERGKFIRNIFKCRSLVQNEIIYDQLLDFQEQNSMSRYFDEVNPLEQSMKSQDQSSIQLSEHGGLNQSCKSIQKKKLKSSMKLRIQEKNSHSQKARKSTIKADFKVLNKEPLLSLTNIQLKLLSENYYAETLDNFDKICSYSEYFPQNNLSNVLREARQFNQKKLNFPIPKSKMRKGKSSYVY